MRNRRSTEVSRASRTRGTPHLANAEPNWQARATGEARTDVVGCPFVSVPRPQGMRKTKREGGTEAVVHAGGPDVHVDAGGSLGFSVTERTVRARSPPCRPRPAALELPRPRRLRWISGSRRAGPSTETRMERILVFPRWNECCRETRARDERGRHDACEVLVNLQLYAPASGSLLAIAHCVRLRPRSGLVWL